MRKRNKVLIVILLLLVAGIFIWKHKSYSVANIPKEADAIAVFDSKRIIESLAWEFITTPALWKSGKLFSSSEEVSWREMFSIPDYLIAFHLKDQPLQKWYAVIPIKDEKKFRIGIRQRGFIDDNDFFKHENGFNGKMHALFFVVGYNADSLDILSVAKQIEGKQWIDISFLENAINDKKQGVITIQNNAYTGNIHLQFNRSQYEISTQLKQEVDWKTSDILVDCSAAIDLQFTQPPADLLGLISDNFKTKIYSTTNLHPDSLLLTENEKYSLIVSEFTTKMDTIITYEYDDDFNPIEQKKLEEVTEPSLALEIKTDAATRIENYCKQSGTTALADNNQLQFTALPLVTSYLRANDSLFTIESYQYQKNKNMVPFTGFLYASLNTSLIKSNAGRYLPEDWQKILEQFSLIHLQGNNKKLLLTLTRN